MLDYLGILRDAGGKPETNYFIGVALYYANYIPDGPYGFARNHVLSMIMYFQCSSDMGIPISISLAICAWGSPFPLVI